MAHWGSLKKQLGGGPKVPQKPALSELLSAHKRPPEQPEPDSAKLTCFRRGDREREREERYLAEQVEREAAAKRRRREWAGLREAAEEQRVLAGGAKLVWLPNQEVIRRLRERGEPITLFGEQDADRLRRLHELASSELNLDDMTDLGKNQFRERLAKAQTDALERDKTRIEQGKSAEEVAAEEEAKLADVVREKAAELGKLDEEIAAMHAGASADEPPAHSDPTMAKYVGLFIERVLLEWKIKLLQRPWDTKKSYAGKKESARHEETLLFMQPLLESLRKKDTAMSVLDPFHKIAFFTLQKEYVHASHFYLQMAIGNAAWPLGVTQVGIHSRVGRERIMSSKQAHILNNETQRKFIQGMKRLVSQMQIMHPTAHSKMIQDI
eukprot:TRINITY_DN7672_c0_g1_i1.p1 TRINITY_DN7672_c0_g1~~TRINITY_DN7672_c0_g1_i1.p1  ORF type:complete len:382 (+),score=137.09 TRINITY_DN7672_c0_g1_i1:80-1225(+)